MYICGWINHSSAPFKYSQVIYDSSGKIEITKILSSKKNEFSRNFTLLIQLKTESRHLIISLSCYNAKECFDAFKAGGVLFGRSGWLGGASRITNRSSSSASCKIKLLFVLFRLFLNACKFWNSPLSRSGSPSDWSEISYEKL